jgi:hypothetical protein
MKIGIGKSGPPDIFDAINLHWLAAPLDFNFAEGRRLKLRPHGALPLGAQPNLGGHILHLVVSCLLGIDAERLSLIPDFFDLIHSKGFG